MNSFFFKSFNPPSGIWNSIWHFGHFGGFFEIAEHSKHCRQKLWAQGNILGSVMDSLQTTHNSKTLVPIIIVEKKESYGNPLKKHSICI